MPQPVGRRSAQTFHFMLLAFFLAHRLQRLIKDQLEEGADLAIGQAGTSAQSAGQRRGFIACWQIAQC